MRNPPHPGELIRESMDELGWSVTGTAARLECQRETLSRLLNGQAGVSASMAEALENRGWGYAEHWMRMQASYERSQTLRGRAVARHKRRNPNSDRLSAATPESRGAYPDACPGRCRHGTSVRFRLPQVRSFRLPLTLPRHVAAVVIISLPLMGIGNFNGTCRSSTGSPSLPLMGIGNRRECWS